ncbi:sigma-70 family RNA polymerase sigma factor [Treponema sp.]|uniref:sigma-70 family RNA polymerase sigma factor n=1 Tax=Treponema sp. TaxID=166 RepID=UPI003F0CFA73
MDLDIAQQYLNSIRKYPLLSADDEVALAARIRQGDKDAFQLLVNSNLRLVVSIAAKFKPDSFTVMDLIQEGNMGLMAAAHKYNPSFGTRFSTYAYKWISQYIMKFLNSGVSLITIPVHKEQLLRRIRKIQDDFFHWKGREASVQELSLLSGISEEKIASALECPCTMISLDAEVSDCKNSAMLAELISDTSLSPEESAVREESRSYVNSFMKKLAVNERAVLWHRYNFDNELHEKTLRDISRIIGLSPEAVRQTEIRAKKHLRSAMESVCAV